MSSICLTCDDNINKLPTNCVFTAQGDIQCYNNGTTPEGEMNAAIRMIATAKAGTPSAQIYPVRGVTNDGYYEYISDLSGEPIRNRYAQSPADSSQYADAINSCASCAATTMHKIDSAVIIAPSTENIKSIPEWGPHSGWLKKKDAHILNGPYYSQ